MKPETEIDQALLQANPQLATVIFLFGLFVLLVLSTSVSLWLTSLLRWWRGLPILSLLPWKPRAWGLVDVVLVLILAFLGQAVLIRGWADMTGTDLRQMIDSQRISLSVMAVGSASYLLAMLGGVSWLAIRYRSSAEHMGLSVRRLLPDIALGLAAAAMSLPLVAAMSYLLSEGLDAEYKHPLIEELKQEGTLSAYLLAVFSAVLVAPLVEEFLFRVLLQGWLQSLPWSVGRWWWLFGLGQAQSTALMDSGHGEPTGSANLNSQDETDPPVVTNPYAASGTTMPTLMPTPAPQTSVPSATPPLWPAFVAGALFGLAHFDYGLSFIPLTVLGVVLGLLYRATHSIWPCFVVHFALNGTSMISLGIGLLVEAAK